MQGCLALVQSYHAIASEGVPWNLGGATKEYEVERQERQRERIHPLQWQWLATCEAVGGAGCS